MAISCGFLSRVLLEAGGRLHDSNVFRFTGFVGGRGQIT